MRPPQECLVIGSPARRRIHEPRPRCARVPERRDRSRVAGDPERRLHVGREQLFEIKKINERLAKNGNDFRLLTGIEVDIVKNGLDLPNEILSELDVVVASLHVPSNDEKENTKRLIRAAENKYVHIIAHMTGRLLLEREPYPVDVRAVIDACARTGTWLAVMSSRMVKTCGELGDAIGRGLVLGLPTAAVPDLEVVAGAENADLALQPGVGDQLGGQHHATRAVELGVEGGAEEVALTLLEVAVELAELRAANAHDKHATVPLDEHWLSWAAEERLFDAEEGQDDWIRFHSLWTRLRLLTSRAEEALTAVREAERGGELPPAEAAQLLSMALEDLGDLPRAGAEARRRLEALEKPWPVGDVVRTAHLLGTKELLEEAANQWPTDSDEAEMLRGAAGISPVVQLGKKS